MATRQVPKGCRSLSLILAVMFISALRTGAVATETATVSGVMEMKPGITVPLPPGNWTVIKEQEWPSDGATNWRRILLSVNQEVIDRATFIYSREIYKWKYFTTPKKCKNSFYYYQEEPENKHGKGACWHVRVVNLGTAGNPHAINKYLSRIAKEKSVYLPITMIGVRFVRHEWQRFLQVDYLWNADLLLPHPGGGVWRPQEWDNESVKNDPAKKVIMETIKAWSAAQHARILTGFDGDLKVTKAAPKSEETKPAKVPVQQDVENDIGR